MRSLGAPTLGTDYESSFWSSVSVFDDSEDDDTCGTKLSSCVECSSDGVFFSIDLRGGWVDVGL